MICVWILRESRESQIVVKTQELMNIMMIILEISFSSWKISKTHGKSLSIVLSVRGDYTNKISIAVTVLNRNSALLHY